MTYHASAGRDGVYVINTKLDDREGPPVLGPLTPWDAATLSRSLGDKAREAGHWAPCQHCPAAVMWATTEPGGKAILLDIGDHPAGRMACRKADAGRLVVRSCRPDQPLRAGERRVMPHFATCPGADKARKRPAVPRRT